MSTQRQFLLGAFFLIALGTLAFFTLFLTDFSLFKEPVVLNVAFKDAYSLREGNDVTVNGLRAGRVKRLYYEASSGDDYKIKAELHLEDEVRLTDGARIVIKESTLLGGRVIDIYPGPLDGPDALIPEDGFIRGDVIKNPISSLGEVGTLIQENSESIRRILEGIQEIVDTTSSGRGPVGRFLMDEELAEDLTSSVTDLRAVAEEARKISEDISRGTGLVGSLVHDEELAGRFSRTLANFEQISQDLRDGRGLAGQLVYDDRLANKVESAIESFRSFGERMDQGQGILGKLMADEELSNDLVEIVKNMRTVTDDITVVSANVRNGEGSLGKLLMEPELYEEALTSVKLLTRSLEDYREAAPVSTFTSVLFSAF